MSKKEKKQKLGKLAQAAKRARKGKASAGECSCSQPTERAIVAFDRWQPSPVPAAESATLPPYSSDAAYSCSDDAYAGRKKTVVVDFLYLDLTVCERCQGADKRVERAVELCRPVLAACGYDITLNSVNVDSEWLAEQYGFYSSPTVRVNNVDICPSIEENDCDCCGAADGFARARHHGGRASGSHGRARCRQALRAAREPCWLLRRQAKEGRGEAR